MTLARVANKTFIFQLTYSSIINLRFYSVASAVVSWMNIYGQKVLPDDIIWKIVPKSMKIPKQII